VSGTIIEATKTAILVVSALIPIVNPLGGSPIFLSLTREYLPQSRKVLARRIAFNSFILLIGSFAIGSRVLSFFGISLPVVQAGGGLIVISTAWKMLKQEDESDREAVGRKVISTNVSKDAFYPLTLPLTVGPGAISIAITLGANGPHQLKDSLAAIIAAAIGSAAVALIIYLSYNFSDRLAAAIGASGMNVILRLSAFLLVCIGVQILWNGASQLLSSLPLHHA
jgi:multiple antibiotic resistance protein